MKKQQQGGTILGFILGLVVGLGAALGVAVYVSKVPVPFVDKAGLRGAGQDELEAAKNKNWDPNSPLYGKNPAPTNAPAASGVVGADSPEPDTAPALVGDKDAKATKEAKDSKDAKATKDAKDAKEAKEAARAGDPLGDLAKAKTNANASASDNTDPFTYFVQAGAFRTQADAEAQRAKLAIQGWEARVSEREQSGRTVFRVRIGPFDKRTDADQIRNKLDALKVESNLVRVQR
ncbi:MAG: SPOR domain-containing protein [Giesbergeria sp.]|mgnify:CR=1 FL=1|nr:SPOR domain-containing protein [Giesbergeria sp.]MBP6419373.1 SPOR domain-containing protein [Giesbergeria sp.]